MNNSKEELISAPPTLSQKAQVHVYIYPLGMYTYLHMHEQVETE